MHSATKHPNWGFHLEPLGVQDHKGRWLWKLVNDFDVNHLISFPERKARIQVQMATGFLFDGSSAPQMLWRLMPPMTGLHLRASLVHDWLYVHKMAWVDGSYEPISKEWADWIFRELMLMDGYPSWKAKGAYSAVVAFGKGDWDD